MISFYVSGNEFDFTYILWIIWTSRSFEKITGEPRWEGLICFFVCFMVPLTHGDHKSMLVGSGKCLELHHGQCPHLFFCSHAANLFAYWFRFYILQHCLIIIYLTWQTYQHASAVIQSLVEEDINVKFLVQLDKLIRLLETPIFAYLRLQVTNETFLWCLCMILEWHISQMLVYLGENYTVIWQHDHFYLSIIAELRQIFLCFLHIFNY